VRPANPASGGLSKTQPSSTLFYYDFHFETDLWKKTVLEIRSTKQKSNWRRFQDLTSIRWLTKRELFVGRSISFSSSTLRSFFNVVQPLESGFCPVNPVPLKSCSSLNCPQDLEQTTICPEPGFQSGFENQY